MFLWIKLDWGVHPRLCTPSASGDEADLQLHKLEHRIAAKALEYRVLVKKRSLFSFKKRHNSELHFRVTFAAAPEMDLRGCEVVCEYSEGGVL